MVLVDINYLIPFFRIAMSFGADSMTMLYVSALFQRHWKIGKRIFLKIFVKNFCENS